MTWRIAAFLGLTSCFSTHAPANAQGLAGVSFSSPGARASVLLPQLGKAIGRSLQASPSTADDVLVIRLAGVTRQDALDRVAAALDAGWVQEGDTLRLVRSSSNESAERQAALQSRTQAWRRAQQSFQKRLASEPAFDQSAVAKTADRLAQYLQHPPTSSSNSPEFEEGRRIDDASPAIRAVHRLMAAIPPEELAAIRPGLATVWSTRPTKMQIAFPDEAEPAWNGFVQEDGAWEAALKTRNLVWPKRVNQWLSLLERPMAQVGPPAGCLLRATQETHNGEIRFEMVAVDSDGHRITRGLADFRPDFPSEKPSWADDSPLDLDSETQSELKDLKQATQGKPATGALREDLLHPEDHDPATLVVGPALIAVAARRKQNLVAWVPDETWSAQVNFARNGIARADWFLQSLSPFMKLEETGGWITARPADPEWNRTVRLDRATLGAHLRKLAAQGYLSLDDQAAWAVASTRPQDNEMSEALQGYLVPMHGQPQPYLQLRMYGSLTPQERNQAESDLGLGFDSMNAIALETLNWIVYGNERYLLRADQRVAGMFTRDFDLIRGAGSESTVLLPTGPPREGGLRLRIESLATFQAVRVEEGGSYPTQLLDLGSFAMMVLRQSHPELFPGIDLRESHLDLDHVQYALGRRIGFEFRLGPDIYASPMWLTDSAVAAQPFARLQDLPSDVLDQLTKAMDDARSVMERVNRRKAGAGAPPPAP